MILSLFFFFRNLLSAVVGAARRQFSVKERIPRFPVRARGGDIYCNQRADLSARKRRGQIIAHRKGIPLVGIPYTGSFGSLTPLTIPGISQWYDAADTSTIIGSPVSEWRDKSGNGFHLQQPNLAERPVSGAVVNTQNAITFSGSQWMAALDVVNKPNTEFFVFKTISPSFGTDTAFFGCSTTAGKVPASAHNTGVYGKSSDTEVFTTASATYVQLDGVGGAVLADFNNPAVGVGFPYNPLNTVAHLIVYTDDLATAESNNYVVGASPLGAVGTGHIPGYYCEKITYNRALSVGEIGTVATYLILKWIFVPGGGGD